MTAHTDSYVIHMDGNIIELQRCRVDLSKKVTVALFQLFKVAFNS